MNARLWQGCFAKRTSFLHLHPYSVRIQVVGLRNWYYFE